MGDAAEQLDQEQVLLEPGTDSLRRMAESAAEVPEAMGMPPVVSLLVVECRTDVGEQIGSDARVSRQPMSDEVAHALAEGAVISESHEEAVADGSQLLADLNALEGAA